MFRPADESNAIPAGRSFFELIDQRHADMSIGVIFAPATCGGGLCSFLAQTVPAYGDGLLFTRGRSHGCLSGTLFIGEA